MNMKIYLMILLLLSLTAYGKELVELKSVPLLEFMQDDLSQSYPINILVPTEYKAFEFAMDEPGKYFWMRSKDAKKVKKYNDLPTKKGFMYGKITMNVGYDTNKDLFIGVEDTKTQEDIKAYFDEFTMQRTDLNDYPVLLIKMLQKENKKPSYLMYIATKISTNVLVIAYIPPNYNVKKGDYVWERQLALFKQSKTAVNEQ